MQKLFNRSLYILGFLVVFVFFSGLFDSKEIEVPTLPTALQQVECLPKPATERHAEKNKALLTFKSSAVYDICIPLEMMKYKDKLKCSYNDMDELVCDKTAIIQRDFIHADNKVYATDRISSKTKDPKSSVEFLFSQTSFEKYEMEKKYYAKEFELTRGVVTPSKMRLRFPLICEDTYNGQSDDEASAKCVGDFAFNDLYIRMELELFGDQTKQKVKQANQVKEINFWSQFLAELLTTPPKDA